MMSLEPFKKRRNAFERFHIESIEKVRIEFVREEIFEEWKKQCHEDEVHLVQNNNQLRGIPMEVGDFDERLVGEGRREKQDDVDDGKSTRRTSEREAHLLRSMCAISTDERQNIRSRSATNNEVRNDQLSIDEETTVERMNNF